MTSRHIAILGVVAVIAVLGAFWSTSIRDNRGLTGSDFLVPGLVDQINDVNEFRVFGPGNVKAITLNRGERGWIIAERYGYHADAGKLRKFLLDLADAQMLEKRTSNPELYSRLGVEDIDSDEAQGRRVEIDGLGHPVSIIVGNKESGREMTNVRMADNDVTWLATGDLSVDVDPTKWLDKQLLAVPADRVYQVRIRHPDGNEVSIQKDAPGPGNYVVNNIPEGRELKFETVANSIGSALASLTCEDVLPATEFEAPGEPTRAEYRTFDGMVIAIDAFEDETARFLKIGLAYDARLAQEFAAAGDEEDATEEEESGATPGADEAVDEPDVEQEVRRLNQRLGGWVFTVTTFRYDQLSKTPEDLFKPAALPTADE